MKRQNWLTLPALVSALILTAALIDAAAIITRPLWPFVAWMLP